MTVSVANIKRYIVGATVYLGATAATAFNKPTLTAGVPTGGIDVGATRDGAEFTYNAHIESGRIEQTTGPVAPIVTAEEMGCTIRMAETDYVAMQKMLQQAFPVAVGSNPTTQVLHLGNRIDVTGQTVTVVAPLADKPGKYFGFQLYSAYIAGEVKNSIKRGDVEHAIELKFMATADPTRPDGDQLGQWFEDT